MSEYDTEAKSGLIRGLTTALENIKAKLAAVERERDELQFAMDKTATALGHRVGAGKAYWETAEQLMADLAAARADADKEKQRADGFWGCIQEEMVENAKLFHEMGIWEEVEKADECSAKLIRRAWASMQQERDTLRAQRDAVWLRFAATRTHEDFAEALDTLLTDHMELESLIKALPVVEGEVTVWPLCSGLSWLVNTNPASHYGQSFDDEAEAHAYAALLEARRKML